MVVKSLDYGCDLWFGRVKTELVVMVGPHIPPQQFTHQNRAKSDLVHVVSVCAGCSAVNVFSFIFLPKKFCVYTIKKKKKKKGSFFFLKNGVFNDPTCHQCTHPL